MLSVRASGVCAPAFAYFTVYCMLFVWIILLNVSLYFPVTLAGFIVIPVT